MYSVNGETSDWMWAKHGIFAMSPEVGPAFLVASEQGFWPSIDEVPNIAVEMHYSNLVASRFAGPDYEFSVVSIHAVPSNETMEITWELVNRGLRATSDVTLTFSTSINAEHAEVRTVVGQETLGTVRDGLTANGKVVIATTSSVHVVVSDSSSCRYNRIAVSSRAYDATLNANVAFEQWKPFDLPPCSWCQRIADVSGNSSFLPAVGNMCKSLNLSIELSDLMLPVEPQVHALISSAPAANGTSSSSSTTIVAAPTSVAPVATTATVKAKTTNSSFAIPNTPATETLVPSSTATTPSTATPVPHASSTLMHASVVTAQANLSDAPSASLNDAPIIQLHPSKRSFPMSSSVFVPAAVSILLAIVVVVALVIRRRRHTQMKPRASYSKVRTQDAVGVDDDDDDAYAGVNPFAVDTVDSDEEEAEYGRRRYHAGQGQTQVQIGSGF